MEKILYPVLALVGLFLVYHFFADVQHTLDALLRRSGDCIDSALSQSNCAPGGPALALR